MKKDNFIIENNILKDMELQNIITIPNNVKVILGQKEEIDDKYSKYGRSLFYEALNNNSVIEKITMNNNVLIIGEKAFQNCINLETVKFSNKLQTIKMLSFYNCNKLKTIHLPSSLRKIEYGAFKGINDLTIFYDGDENSWNDVIKEENWCDTKTIIYTKDKTILL